MMTPFGIVEVETEKRRMWEIVLLDYKGQKPIKMDSKTSEMVGGWGMLSGRLLRLLPWAVGGAWLRELSLGDGNEGKGVSFRQGEFEMPVGCLSGNASLYSEHFLLMTLFSCL